MNIVYAFSQLLKTQECILDKKNILTDFKVEFFKRELDNLLQYR